MKSEMELQIIATVAGLWSKFLTIASSVMGWLGVAIIWLISYFAGIGPSLAVLGILLIIDMIAGMLSSYKRGELITSDKWRNTLIKAGIYMILIICAFMIETTIGFGTSIGHSVIFGFSGLIELYSIAANLLIVKPDMPLLRIISFLVKGEIKKKLGTDEDFLDN